MQEKIAELETRIKNLEEAIFQNGTQVPIQEKKLSVAEFLEDIKPKNDVERTACFGYYLEKYDGLESFNRKNIIDCFRRAKQPIPANTSDKIQQCISKCWIMETGIKSTEKINAYTLTATGEKTVKNKFMKEASSQ